MNEINRATVPKIKPIKMPSAGRLTRGQASRAAGAALGAAVGDALGAPFEFGPPGAFSSRFPSPVVGGTGEMCGGGTFGWAPGEFTDDTQMALALAQSLVANGGLSPEDLWARWREWAESAPDVGITTSAALRSLVHQGAAASAHELTGRSGGNGAVMRVWPVGIAAAARSDGGERFVRDAAFAQGSLTHAEPDAAWGASLVAEVIRLLILGDSLADALVSALTLLPRKSAELFGDLTSSDWHPGIHDAPSNGSVWGCVAQAVWAVRQGDDFASVMRLAIDLGGDTDTVASVAGAIAGALHGVQSIPSRWTTYVHGTVGARPTETFRRKEILDIVRRLTGAEPGGPSETESPAGPTEVDENLYAASFPGVVDYVESRAGGLSDIAVLSLCRVASSLLDVPLRREVHLYDNDHNEALPTIVADCVDTIDAWLTEGRRVIVHCHGGRSRTALVLMAWAMRHRGHSHDDARRWLRERWPRMEEWTPSFSAFLEHDWMRT